MGTETEVTEPRPEPLFHYIYRTIQQFLDGEGQRRVSDIVTEGVSYQSGSNQGRGTKLNSIVLSIKRGVSKYNSFF